jgi:hypothetical protein
MIDGVRSMVYGYGVLCAYIIQDSKLVVFGDSRLLGI